jgi:AAA15 family ATPase/GTPase
MQASKIKHFEEYNIELIDSSISDNDRILKSIVLIGANSAGKTNFLKSISYARYLIMNSANAARDKENILDDPDTFMFDENAESEPTEFHFEFSVDNGANSTYFYDFAFCKKKILYEKLYKRETNKKTRLATKKCLFDRKGKVIEKNSDAFEKLAEVFEISDSVLFLSNCTGNLKSDMCPDGKIVIDWFSNITFANMESSCLDIYDDKPEYLDIALKLLSLTNKSIKNIKFEKRKLDLGVLDYKNPDAVFKALNKKKIGNVGGGIRLSEDGLYVFDIFMEYEKVMLDGKVKKIRLSIFDDSYSVSSGERKLIIYLAPIIKILKEGGLLLVDEIDTALHYNFSKIILSLFNNAETNQKKAQALFTTHNVKLIDENLRIDQIFTAKKDDFGVSAISMLSEGDKSPRKVHKLSERYLSGLYGSVPDINFKKVKILF